ncbi:MAG: DUF2202 domain-containing protein [Anaerolineales bacterium]|uniref:DUF2202 domain-containing protein n=1 Tax=Candidatus Villigracilis proximus TaxID=3140683 RepID=UPI0031350748|nr:DUF2202 domain-containing protein [Anaerolineales bacterium]
MFKTLKTLLAGILAAVIIIAIGASVYTAFAAPGTNIFSTQSQTAATNGNGNGNGGNDGTGTSVLDIPASDLSAEEAAALLFMREEEKLARDVYNALYTTWGQQTFTNIASSEQMHMDEIKVLLDRYALTDPALAPGQFTDPALQALYTQLVAQGNLSLADALKVGAAIEEIDIRDLQTRMAETDNADIQQAYTNLMNGSYSHLKAFTGTLLTQTGETYVPQYLTAEQYQAIISSAGNGQGNSGGGQATGGQGQGGQGQGGQGAGQASATGGVAQADLTAATTIHGTVVSFDQMGLSLTLDDGSAFYIQLGNSRYSQSIGFAPAIGEGVTVYGFPGDQGVYSAITVTRDSTAQVYAFRDATTGQPLWSGGGNGGGGNGNGGGNH